MLGSLEGRNSHNRRDSVRFHIVNHTILLVMMSAGADEMDAGFEELAKLSPAERFEQWTSKDSRRWEQDFSSWSPEGSL